VGIGPFRSALPQIMGTKVTPLAPPVPFVDQSYHQDTPG
jgi:hypothetical protein